MYSLLLSYKYGALPIPLIDKNNHVKIVATYKDCDLDNMIIDVFSNYAKQQVKKIIENKNIYYDKLIECEKKIENI